MAKHKRYHGTHHPKHEGHEGGMKHYSGKHDSEGMIHNDYGAIANMPPHAMVKGWPKCEDSLLSIPSDDIRGIDMQIDQAVRSIEANKTTRKN